MADDAKKPDASPATAPVSSDEGSVEPPRRRRRRRSDSEQRTVVVVAQDTCCSRCDKLAGACLKVMVSIALGVVASVIAMGATPPVMRMVLHSRGSVLLTLYTIGALLLLAVLGRYAVHACACCCNSACGRCRRRRAARA